MNVSIADPASITRSEDTETLRLKYQDGKLLAAEPTSQETFPPGDPQPPTIESGPDPLGPTSHHAGVLNVPEDDEEDDDVMEIHTHFAGGYRVQYTNEAQKQMEGLDVELCSRIDGAVQSVAAVSPRNRSSQVEGMPDRRRVKVEGMLVTFWLSEAGLTGRILTVVDVTHEAEVLRAKEKSASILSLPKPKLKGLPYVHFLDDPEDAGRRLHPPVAS
ncbi:hypothetical protein ABT282_08195 [Streptomyces sp. NPDC000927]|uniref:type II toxin-antitoxin system RelE family toxin n=1 Tax=Streptomyces sp. NPDC000927 TaxID=3154371 RepID=UPI003333D135